jgi:hypothetical protein
MTKQGVFSRLEDFITIARKGKEVALSVELDKRIFTRKYAPYTMGDPGDEIDTYILAANYVFFVEEKSHEFTKFYAFGVEGDSTSAVEREIDVANERLKMDYKRLRDANIVFSEKFFRISSDGNILN